MKEKLAQDEEAKKAEAAQVMAPAQAQPKDEKTEHRRKMAEARAKALEKKKLI